MNMMVAHAQGTALRNRRGRKRKSGRRHPNGELAVRGDNPQEVALAQPHRQGWHDLRPLDHMSKAGGPHDTRLGYPLGRLLLAGYITEKQHSAGQHWAGIVRRYASLIVGASENCRAINAEMVGTGGESCAQEPDEVVILAIRRIYNDCYAVLEQVGRDARTGHGPLKACRQICVQEIDEKILWPTGGLGNLRIGLNALSRMFAQSS